MPQRRLSVGQPARGVHNGATAPRRHHGAASEGAPRLGDVLDVPLPYGLQHPQRRPRSRGLEPRYTTRSRTSHDIVGLFRARTMGASHRRAGAAATSITASPRLGFDNRAAVVFVCDVAPVKRPLARPAGRPPQNPCQFVSADHSWSCQCIQPNHCSDVAHSLRAALIWAQDPASQSASTRTRRKPYFRLCCCIVVCAVISQPR